MMKNEMLRKIENREIVVGVVGLGYVGLPLAVEKAKAGFKTIGFDVQAQKVEMVNAGHNYIGDVVDSDLAGIVKSGMLSATTDFSFVKDVDFVAICVPTPLDAHQQPDISYVRDSAPSVSKYLKKGTMVVLESTTYPGTTEELIKPILEQGSGLKCGEDFYLGFSPERVDPGNLIYKTKNTPKVVGAIGKDATEVIAAMYRAVLDGEVYEVSSPRSPRWRRFSKTLTATSTSAVNELAMLCNEMGISMWEVVDAAKTKPYGFQAFYPGPGLGGHCIPLDPYYLSWKAREYGFHTSMIESSMMINDKMPEYCVDRAAKLLNRRAKKAMNGSKVLVLGVAYKQDIDDYRESPALRVIEELEKEGAVVTYFDPWVKEYKYKGQVRQSIPALTEQVLKDADLVMVTTAHTNVDYDMVQKNAALIFDSKNAMKNIQNRDNIEVL